MRVFCLCLGVLVAISACSGGQYTQEELDAAVAEAVEEVGRTRSADDHHRISGAHHNRAYHHDNRVTGDHK